LPLRVLGSGVLKLGACIRESSGGNSSSLVAVLDLDRPVESCF